MTQGGAGFVSPRIAGAFSDTVIVRFRGADVDLLIAGRWRPVPELGPSFHRLREAALAEREMTSSGLLPAPVRVVTP